MKLASIVKESKVLGGQNSQEVSKMDKVLIFKV
jgi:hypothetical protein